jgi:hypothetical protein
MKVTETVEVRAESTVTDSGIQLGVVLMSGTISYDTFAYPERIKKYQEIMGGIETDPDKVTIDDDFKLVTKYYEVFSSRVISIECKLQDGTPINDAETLYEYNEGIAIGNEVAKKIVTGQRLGKSK